MPEGKRSNNNTWRESSKWGDRVTVESPELIRVKLRVPEGVPFTIAKISSYGDKAVVESLLGNCRVIRRVHLDSLTLFTPATGKSSFTGERKQMISSLPKSEEQSAGTADMEEGGESSEWTSFPVATSPDTTSFPTSEETAILINRVYSMGKDDHSNEEIGSASLKGSSSQNITAAEWLNLESGSDFRIQKVDVEQQNTSQPEIQEQHLQSLEDQCKLERELPSFSFNKDVSSQVGFSIAKDSTHTDSPIKYLLLRCMEPAALQDLQLSMVSSWKRPTVTSLHGPSDVIDQGLYREVKGSMTSQDSRFTCHGRFRWEIAWKILTELPTSFSRGNMLFQQRLCKPGISKVLHHQFYSFPWSVRKVSHTRRRRILRK